MKLEFYANILNDDDVERLAKDYELIIFHKRDTVPESKRSWVLSGSQNNIYWFLWHKIGRAHV